MMGWCLLPQLLWIPFLWNQYLVGQFNDDASYLALARSLAQGLPYQDLFEMGAPAATRFPPGYPLVLLPLQLLAPDQLWMPRILSIFFSLAVVWRLAKENRIAACLLAANPFWALSSTMVMSEPLFTLLTMLYLERLQRPATRRQWLILGMAAALCYYVRTVGLALVPASLLWMRRQPISHSLAFVLGFSLAASPHLVLASGYAPEVSGFDPILNLQTLPVHYGAVLLGLPAFELSPLYVCLFLLALFGLARKPELSLAASWTLCYLLVLVLWPYGEPRFALPILPWLLLGLCARLSRPLLGLLLVAQIGLNLPVPPPAKLELPPIPAGARLASSSLQPGLYLHLPTYAHPPEAALDKEWEWDQGLLDQRIDTILLHDTEDDLVRAFQKRYPQLAPKLFAYHPIARAILLHTAARQALLEQRYKSAEWLFRKALEADPQKSSLYSGLALALFRLQRPKEAALSARQGLRLKADNQEARALVDLLP